MRALEKPEVALGAIYARVCVRARIRSSTFTDNSRAFTTATRADLVVSRGAKGMMCKPLSESGFGHLAPPLTRERRPAKRRGAKVREWSPTRWIRIVAARRTS